MQRIERWSFSRLKNGACPLRCKYQYVDRIKEPERGDPPPGMDEWPNDRGTRVHSAAENFIRGERERPPELDSFRREGLVLQHLYRAGVVELEAKWTFDREWCDGGPYGEFKWWLAIIPDVYVRLCPTEAVIGDWKTGKRQWNEIDHAQQMQLYAVAAFLRNLELQQVVTELYYVDLGQMVQHIHRRRTLALHKKQWTQKGEHLTRQRAAWPAVPNKGNCFFCPYKTGLIGKHGPEGLGLCDRNPQE